MSTHSKRGVYKDSTREMMLHFVAELRNFEATLPQRPMPSEDFAPDEEMDRTRTAAC